MSSLFNLFLSSLATLLLGSWCYWYRRERRKKRAGLRDLCQRFLLFFWPSRSPTPETTRILFTPSVDVAPLDQPGVFAMMDSRYLSNRVFLLQLIDPSSDNRTLRLLENEPATILQHLFLRLPELRGQVELIVRRRVYVSHHSKSLKDSRFMLPNTQEQEICEFYIKNEKTPADSQVAVTVHKTQDRFEHESGEAVLATFCQGVIIDFASSFQNLLPVGYIVQALFYSIGDVSRSTVRSVLPFGIQGVQSLSWRSQNAEFLAVRREISQMGHSYTDRKAKKIYRQHADYVIQRDQFPHESRGLCKFRFHKYDCGSFAYQVFINVNDTGFAAQYPHAELDDALTTFGEHCLIALMVLLTAKDFIERPGHRSEAAMLVNSISRGKFYEKVAAGVTDGDGKILAGGVPEASETGQAQRRQKRSKKNQTHHGGSESVNCPAEESLVTEEADIDSPQPLTTDGSTDSKDFEENSGDGLEQIHHETASVDKEKKDISADLPFPAQGNFLREDDDASESPTLVDKSISTAGDDENHTEVHADAQDPSNRKQLPSSPPTPADAANTVVEATGVLCLDDTKQDGDAAVETSKGCDPPSETIPGSDIEVVKRKKNKNKNKNKKKKNTSQLESYVGGASSSTDRSSQSSEREFLQSEIAQPEAQFLSGAPTDFQVSGDESATMSNPLFPRGDTSHSQTFPKQSQLAEGGSTAAGSQASKDDCFKRPYLPSRHHPKGGDNALTQSLPSHGGLNRGGMVRTSGTNRETSRLRGGDSAAERSSPAIFGHPKRSSSRPFGLKDQPAQGFEVGIPPMIEGKMFRFDVPHPLLTCWLPECNTVTTSKDISTVFCPACGPESYVRYCCKEHMFADVQNHWTFHCGRAKICGKIDYRTITPEQMPRREYFKKLNFDMVERHRQALYLAMTPDRDYFIFNDIDLVPEHIKEPSFQQWSLVRGKGTVFLSVYFPDVGSQLTFRYHLKNALIHGVPLHPQSCFIAFHMLRVLLIKAGAWSEKLVTYLCMQVHGEWGGFIVPSEMQEADEANRMWQEEGQLPVLHLPEYRRRPGEAQATPAKDPAKSKKESG